MEMRNQRGNDAYDDGKPPVAQPVHPEARLLTASAPQIEEEEVVVEEFLQLPTGTVVEVPAILGGAQYTYVGVPVDHDDIALPASSGYRHGNVSRGVGNDLEGASRAAKISARRDNAAFNEQKRVTEALARARMEENERALEIARINAKRRDAEGLDMRPHPGNRLEPEPKYDSPGLYGEKALAYARAGAGGALDACLEKQLQVDEEGKKTGAGNDGEEDKTYSAGGYQVGEYQPTQYEVSDYKSVYDAPDASK